MSSEAAGRPGGDGNDTGPAAQDADRDAQRDEVQTLGPGDSGRWLITSRGTTHLLDLDGGVYERRPGPDSHRFAFGNQAVPLTRVEMWPKVGGQMLIWFDDPDSPDLLEHWRVCSTIRGISRAPRPESATASQTKPAAPGREFTPRVT